MITVTELRVGNYFIGYDDKIFEWSLNDFYCLYAGVDVDEIIRTPIPLTPEILEKCGFIGNKSRGSFKKYTNEVDNECVYVTLFEVGNPEWKTEYAYKNEFCPHKKIIKYLHQLQNIYFALTFVELEVKL